MPQLPADEGEAPAEAEAPEEAMERLAHLEQLVVHLKELIRVKDTQLTQRDADLTNKDAQFKVNIQSFSTWRLPGDVLIPLLVNSMRKKSLKPASPSSSCRPRPRWHRSTSRSPS